MRSRGRRECADCAGVWGNEQKETLNLERRHVAAKLVQYEELRRMEEELLLVEAELEQFEGRFPEEEEEEEEERERRTAADAASP